MDGKALVARLERIERMRTAMLDELAAIDDATLAAKPAPGRWSINEIIEHLVQAERAMLRTVTGDEPPPTLRRTIKHRVLLGIVLIVLRVDAFRVKVPAKSMMPRGEASFAELRDEWDGNHRRLRDYAATLDRNEARRPIFRHPVSGPMTPAEAVTVLDVHMRRHFRQIRRILRAA